MVTVYAAPAFGWGAFGRCLSHYLDRPLLGTLARPPPRVLPRVMTTLMLL